MAELLVNQDGSVSKKENLHATDMTARTLGVIGTALAGIGIIGMGGSKLLFGNQKNCNNNCGDGSECSSMANAMTSEDLYIERKQCQNFLDTTKQYYEGRIMTNERMSNLFFDSYKRDIDNSFQLYKYTRDTTDALMQKINDVNTKVDVMAAIRPYQDMLIDNKINTNAILAQYALDKRTCRMIEGQLVLPSTPTVTGYGSYNCCSCVPTTAPAA